MEYYWCEKDDDRYLFCIDQVLNGIKMGSYVKNDQELIDLGMLCLDGLLIAFKTRVKAEEEISQGIVFKSKWGNALGVESSNSGLIKLALKKGFKVVARRDPQIGSVRIKAAPVSNIDLTPVYEAIKREDNDATWFFHPNKKMILNSSLRNPEMIPSKLAIDEVIKIIKRC